MTAPAILAAARAQGVSVTLVPGGTLAVRGPAEARGRLLPAIRESKPALIEALTPHRRWRVHFPDVAPIDLVCCPPATRSELLEQYPSAARLEPYDPPPRAPNAPLSDAEGAKVRAWLDSIGEDDPEIRDEVLDRCETVREARDYFLGLAGEALGADNWDDQRTCGECANLIAGQCRAARWGGPLSQRPIRDLPRRCEGYAPGADDSDRRHGRERWPGLSSERG